MSGRHEHTQACDIPEAKSRGELGLTHSPTWPETPLARGLSSFPGWTGARLPQDEEKRTLGQEGKIQTMIFHSPSEIPMASYSEFGTDHTQGHDPQRDEVLVGWIPLTTFQGIPNVHKPQYKHKSLQLLV